LRPARYARREDEKIVGPISLEDLENVLSIIPDPYNLRVWKAGFSDWTIAGAVREVAALIRTPPPLPETRRKEASEIQPPPPRPTSQNSTADGKNSLSKKRPWSLGRAAIWGLVAMGVVFLVKVMGIQAGTHADPWLTTDGNPAELASHWMAFFATGPVLFVVRTHRSLDKDAPLRRPIQSGGTIGSRAILGGLHHHYIRV
jgi:hypothetical protein